MVDVGCVLTSILAQICIIVQDRSPLSVNPVTRWPQQKYIMSRTRAYLSD